MSVSDAESATDSQASPRRNATSLSSVVCDRSEDRRRARRGRGPLYRPRRIRSRGAMLVLLWVTAASFASSCPLFVLNSQTAFNSDAKVKLIALIVFRLIYAVCAPIAGLLGDFYFGRHKFLHCSALLVWLASVVCVVALLVEYFLPSSATALGFAVLLPACIAITVGLAGIYVVSIPFGVDQMPDGSSEEVSAFIHWLVGAQFLGYLLGDFGTTLASEHNGTGVLVFTVVTVFSASVILCTNYLLRSWFIVEPRCHSPVKTIAGVLRYALTHKYPVNRSALTYWEDGIPSRIDLGKTKYGGPFTNEQVEDVKTLFRVIIVTACILAYVIPAEDLLVSISPYHYDTIQPLLFNNATGIYMNGACVVFVLLHELFVYPLVRNWNPRSLKRVVLFTFSTIAVSIYLMLLDIIGQSQVDATVPCLFFANKTSAHLPINYTAVIVPVAVLTGIQLLAFNVAAFEFICAQSPYHMKGLITGFGAMIIFLASSLGDTNYFIWYISWTDTYSEITCGTWYYLFTMVIGFVGLVLLMVAVRWYKERERDDIVNAQRFAEAYYSNTGLLDSHHSEESF